MTAKIDVVEGEHDGRVVPIEYKRGKPPDVPEGAYLPERAQLCAQVLLLREHGYRCDEAQLYFAAAKRRVSITIDDHLIATTRAAASRAREIAKAESLPPPLVDSPKCYGCSLVPICLPDEVTLLARSQVGTQPLSDSDETDEDERPALRPLQPASDDQVPVYVQDQGARIGVSGECLIITTRDGDKREARLPNTSQICLLGNVQISTQAMRALFERNIPISFFTTGGWYCGRATGLDSKNIELRLAQFRAADNARICLALSRAFVVSKIKNCRTLLRRNHPEPSDVVLGEPRPARAEGCRRGEHRVFARHRGGGRPQLLRLVLGPDQGRGSAVARLRPGREEPSAPEGPCKRPAVVRVQPALQGARADPRRRGSRPPARLLPPAPLRAARAGA
ncbi:MAG: CRISPR-associated endonuclease Cas1 [Polyangiaceae bacterium]|nr:CRISPR-associated endonuclease Cas1 [Polyangiaceae bacterium]